jgi:hypothetical protein
VTSSRGRRSDWRRTIRCPGNREFDSVVKREQAAYLHRLVPAPVAEAGSRGVEELLVELGGDVVMADAPERGSGAEQMRSALELMPVGGDRRKSAQSLGGRLADVLVAADSELFSKAIRAPSSSPVKSRTSPRFPQTRTNPHRSSASRASGSVSSSSLAAST